MAEAQAGRRLELRPETRAGRELVDEVPGVGTQALFAVRARRARSAAKLRRRSQGVEVVDDAGERVREHGADRERRPHPLGLDSAQHLDVLLAEPARVAHGVDRLPLIGALVKEMPDVLPVGLVGDAAQRTDAGPQSLPQPRRDNARRRAPVDRPSLIKRPVRRIARSRSQPQSQVPNSRSRTGETTEAISGQSQFPLAARQRASSLRSSLATSTRTDAQHCTLGDGPNGRHCKRRSASTIPGQGRDRASSH